MPSQAMKSVTSFLNRVLAMSMEDQEIIFRWASSCARTRCLRRVSSTQGLKISKEPLPMDMRIYAPCCSSQLYAVSGKPCGTPSERWGHIQSHAMVS